MTRTLTDKDIVKLWKDKTGPIHLRQIFDPDPSYPYIVGLEFKLNDKDEPYISSVTLPDPHGRSFVITSPDRIYLGAVRSKVTDNLS